MKLTHSTSQLFKASVSREQSKKKHKICFTTAKTLRLQLNNNFVNIWVIKKICVLLTREDVDFNVGYILTRKSNVRLAFYNVGNRLIHFSERK